MSLSAQLLSHASRAVCPVQNPFDIGPLMRMDQGYRDRLHRDLGRQLGVVYEGLKETWRLFCAQPSRRFICRKALRYEHLLVHTDGAALGLVVAARLTDNPHEYAACCGSQPKGGVRACHCPAFGQIIVPVEWGCARGLIREHDEPTARALFAAHLNAADRTWGASGIIRVVPQRWSPGNRFEVEL